MPGYIHLYTGNGKGKTTAALGLALRAAGAGKSVFNARFVKLNSYEKYHFQKFQPILLKQRYDIDFLFGEESLAQGFSPGLQELSNHKTPGRLRPSLEMNCRVEKGRKRPAIEVMGIPTIPNLKVWAMENLNHKLN